MEKKIITLRLPIKLYEEIKLEAERRGWSIHEEIIFRVSEKQDIVSEQIQSPY